MLPVVGMIDTPLTPRPPDSGQTGVSGVPIMPTTDSIQCIALNKVPQPDTAPGSRS